MDLTAVALPRPWVIAGWVCALPAILWAARAAPLSRFAESEQVHVWYGGIFCLVALWTIQATVGEGFTFHLLGVAAFTLIVGPPFALPGTALAVVALIAVRGGEWANAGVAFVTMGVVPVVVTASVLRYSERRLPPNFFVYIFVGTFLGAWIAYGAAALAGAAILTLAAGRPAELVFGEYAPYFLQLGFGEAMLTGMVLTLAVVYRPRWVTTFDDRRYLDGR
jgi:uncharacterized membrane protein